VAGWEARPPARRPGLLSNQNWNKINLGRNIAFDFYRQKLPYNYYYRATII
jgi:hypothetical protein